MECLAKDPAARPASAAVVSERLAATVPADAWTLDAARAWWEQHQPLTRIQATTELLQRIDGYSGRSPTLAAATAGQPRSHPWTR